MQGTLVDISVNARPCRRSLGGAGTVAPTRLATAHIAPIEIVADAIGSIAVMIRLASTLVNVNVRAC